MLMEYYTWSQPKGEEATRHTPGTLSEKYAKVILSHSFLIKLSQSL